MASISVVITEDNGEKKTFELSPAQSNILRDHICMGKSPENDVVCLAGSRTWAIEREGLSDQELRVFREMCEALRKSFTRRF